MSVERIQQLVERWKEQRERGTPLSSEELCRDCPELLDELRRRLDAELEPPQPAGARAPASVQPNSVIVFDPATSAEAERSDTLRRRLRLVTFVYLIQWALFVGAVLLLGDLPDVVVLIEIAVLVAFCLALTYKSNWSRRQLLLAELAVFGIIVLRIVFGQAMFLASGQLLNALGAGDDDKLIYLADTLGTPWLVVIIVYGVFVPNRWQRCALVVCALAALPLALLSGFALAQGVFEVSLVQHCLIKMALRMLFAITIAIYGSFRIDQLQREAVAARQLGRYVLKQCLGKGGMSEVYLAEHQLLRRPCAVKLIRSDRADRPHDQRRFEREVRALAQLSHPNIVEVFDYGVATDGTFYYVMEYLPGVTLHELVKRGGRLPAARAVYMLKQMVAALGAAHAAGLIHRDIKPANAIVCVRGGDLVKLLDFGLVQIHEGEGDARLTREGDLVGTPGFMSPEQIEGKPVDARSDLYSLGVLAYFLLAGRNPFDRPTVRQTLDAHLNDSVALLSDVLSDVEAGLAQIVQRCLAKEPAARFADATALAHALAACTSATGWSAEQAEVWWRESALMDSADPSRPIQALRDS